MKRFVMALGMVLVPFASRAQQPPQRPMMAAASSFASTEVHFNARLAEGQWYMDDAGLTGPSRISIRYGQPHARARKIEGGLIPADTIWRLGANEATTLHSDVDLVIGEQRVERGDYSLFLRYSPAGQSQLVINRQTGNWGTDYDRAKDVGRVPLAVKTLTENEESLGIYLVPTTMRPQSGLAQLDGVLRIRWGKTEFSAPWRVLK